MKTDKELLDYLQLLLDDVKYTGKCILRNSRTGRGWRLHETSQPGGSRDVREAIGNHMDENPEGQDD